MTSSIQSPVSVRTLVRLTGLVMVLIGLVGMHGLASHGAESAAGTDMMMSVRASDALATPASVASSGTQSLVDHAAMVVAEVSSWGRGTLISPDSHGSGDMSMNMVGLCVAILLIGAAGLRFLVNRFRPVRAVWSTPRWVASLRPSGREPDPPSLTALSVQRC